MSVDEAAERGLRALHALPPIHLRRMELDYFAGRFGYEAVERLAGLGIVIVTTDLYGRYVNLASGRRVQVPPELLRDSPRF